VHLGVVRPSAHAGPAPGAALERRPAEVGAPGLALAQVVDLLEGTLADVGQSEDRLAAVEREAERVAEPDRGGPP